MAGESMGYTNILSYPSNIGTTKDKNDVSATDIGYTLGKADFAQRPMSMRKFLEPFDHKSLSDTEAGSKYAAYKTSFARQQLEEFFERNKNSPWFREKYHPDACPSSVTKQNMFKYRLSVFMELYEDHKLDNLVLSGGHEADLVRLLDAIGIKLLGGTDEDVVFYDDYERCLDLISKKAVKELGESTGGAVSGARVTATERLAVDITDAGCDDAILAKTGGSNTDVHAEETKRRQLSADEDGVTTSTSEKKKRKKKRILDAQSARAAERQRRRGDQNKRSVRRSRTVEESTDEVRADPGSDQQEDAVNCGARSSSASSNSSGDSDDDSGSSSSSSGSSSGESDSSAAEAGSTSGEDRSSGSSSSSSSDSDGSESGSSGSSGTRRRPRGHRPSSCSSRDAGHQDGLHSPANVELTGSYSLIHSSHGHDGVDKKECASHGGESDAEMIVLDEKGASPQGEDRQEHNDEMDEDRHDTGQHPEENRDEFGGKAASGITCSADDCSVEMTASSGCNLPSRRPLHHSTVLILPHIPFSVYKKDLNALFSTSPHFLRLAVLDPFLMPSSGGETTVATDPLLPEFGSSTTRRPSASTTRSPDQSGLPVLRRMGWATFASQQLQQSDDGQQQQWVDVDVEAIRSRLVQQAIEAEAPGELLDCLRSAKVIVDHPLRNSAYTRVRTNNRLMSRLMGVCPLRLNSKSLLRRHLVLAARLVYDLDRYRGLWQEEDEVSAPQGSGDTVSPRVDKDMTDEPVASTETAEHRSEADPEGDQVKPPAKTVEPGNSPDNADSLDGAESPLVDGAEDEKPVAVTVEVAGDDPMPIDPGENLLMAANILSSLTSRNPLLLGLTDYLVDEGSAEEELLLAGGFQAISFFSGRPGAEARSDCGGVGNGTLPALYTEPACESSELVQALDRLIFYLRVVHSVDFYAPAVYPEEGAMPHPCRLMHVRPGQAEVDRAVAVARQQDRQPSPDRRAAEAGGQPATSAGGGSNSRYEQVFSSQLNRLLRLCRPLAERDCRLLGLRSADEVAEAFIQANTKRKKRKTDVIWVCPLSDKKFRDPIYVRKHILNKHLDKIEATKKENALFFNNYLLDAARPQLPLEPQVPKTKHRRLRGCRRRKTSANTDARQAGVDEAVSEDDRGRRLPAGDGRRGPMTTLRMGPGGAGWPQKPSAVNHYPAATGHWPSQSGQMEYLDRRPQPPLPFPGYRQQQQHHRFPPRLPFYPHHQQQQSGMSMRFPRLPFNQMRGNRFMGAIRRGFNTRPYVDLDAP